MLHIPTNRIVWQGDPPSLTGPLTFLIISRFWSSKNLTRTCVTYMASKQLTQANIKKIEKRDAVSFTRFHLTTRSGPSNDLHDNGQLDWLILYRNSSLALCCLIRRQMRLDLLRHTAHRRNLTMLTAQDTKTQLCSPETKETVCCCAETLSGGDQEEEGP